MGLYKQKFNPVSAQFNLVPSSTSGVTFKDSVATYSALPPSGNTLNDARLTNDTGHLYIWNGTTWVDQGNFIDITWDAIIGKPTSTPAQIDNGIVKKYEIDIGTLNLNDSYTITHDADSTYKRLVQVIQQLEAQNTLIYDSFHASNYVFNPSEIQMLSVAQINPILGAAGMVFDSVCNANFNDEVNSYNGTPINCTFGPGIVDNAIVLNGTTSYINLPNNTDLNCIDPTVRSISFEFWIKTTATDGEIINLWNEAANRRSWKLYLQSGILHFDVSTDGTTVAATSSFGSAINTGNWTHVCVYLNNIYGGFYYKAYINGFDNYPGFSGSFAYPLFNNTIDSVRIGALAGSSPAEYLNASFCEFAIYRGKDMSVAPNYNWSNQAQYDMNFNMMYGHLSTYNTNLNNIKTSVTGRINTSSWLGIRNIYATMTGDMGLNIYGMFSVDGGVTWKKWDMGVWTTALETDQGTNLSMFPTDKESWDLLFVAGTLDILIQLQTSNPTSTPTLYSLSINYFASGEMDASFSSTFQLISPTQTKIINNGGPLQTGTDLYGVKASIII